MLHAETTCSPKALTPSRCEWESRPLRELPPAFLCAIAKTSLTYTPSPSRGRDGEGGTPCFALFPLTPPPSPSRGEGSEPLRATRAPLHFGRGGVGKNLFYLMAVISSSV